MQKQVKIVLFVVLLTLALACLLGLSVNAETYFVADEDELLDAIGAAANGDTISITDDITVTSVIPITQDLTFTGTSGKTLENTSGGLFGITGSASVTLTLSDITFQASGYLLSATSSGEVHIIAEDCTLASTAYSAIWLDGTGVMDFTATDTTITAVNASSSTKYRGIIIRKGGAKTLTLTNCDVSANDDVIYLESPAKINISGGTLSDATVANADTCALINVAGYTAWGTDINIENGAELTASHFRQGLIRVHGYANVTIGDDVVITDSKSAGTLGPAIGASNNAFGSVIKVMTGAALTGANGTAVGSLNAAATINSAAGTGYTEYAVEQTPTGTVLDVSDESGLTAAISAAVAGDVIRLTADITVSSTLTITKNLTFTADSAYTLDQSGSGVALFTITGTTTLTIGGYLHCSVSGGNRAINVNQSAAKAVVVIKDHADVTSKNNTIYAASSLYTAIVIKDSAAVHSTAYDGVEIGQSIANAIVVVDVRGGTVEAVRNGIRHRRNDGTSALTFINVRGGTVRSTAGNSGIQVGSYNTETAWTGITVVSVSGGLVTNGAASGNVGAVDFNSVTTSAYSLLYITGGEIRSVGGSAVSFRKEGSVNYAYISGGTLSTTSTSTTYRGVIDMIGTCTLEMTGGTIAVNAAGQIGIEMRGGTQTVTVTGGTVGGTHASIQVHHTLAVTPTIHVGGTANLTSTGYGVLIAQQGAAVFTMTGGTISSTGGIPLSIDYNNAVGERSGITTATISGGTLSTTGSYAAVRIVEKVNADSTLTVTGGTFVSPVAAVQTDCSDAAIALDGGVYTNATMVIKYTVNATGTVTIGKSGTALTLPTSGKLYQLAAAGNTEPTVVIGGVTITPFSLDTLTYFDTEAHAAAGVVAYIGTYGAIDCQYFGSLALAIAGASSGDTIVVYRSEVQSATLNISLAGTLTITSTNAVTVSYTNDVFSITGSTTLILTGNVTYASTGNNSYRVIAVNTASINPNVTLGGNVRLEKQGTSGGHAIWIGGTFNGTIHITVQDNAYLTAGRFDCIDVNSASTGNLYVTVSGGTLAGTRAAIRAEGTGGTATLTVTGGTLSSTAGSVIYLTRPSTVHISGGTVTAADATNVIELTGTGITANIYGGTLTGRVYVNNAGAVLNVFGGTFNQGSGNADLACANAGTINVYGGSFTLAGSTGTVFTEGTGTVNLACGYVIRGGETYFTGESYADPSDKVYTGNTITRDTGAQVRMVAESAGLRFISHIDAATVAAVEGITGVSGIKYYTILFPASHVASLGGNVTPANIFATLTEGGQYAKVEASDGKMSDGEGGWYIRTALVGIKNYTRDFACVAYIQYTVNGQTMILSTAFSAGNDVRNVQDVAQAALDAYNAGTASYNAAQLAILTEFAENDGPTPAAMLVMAPAPAIRKEYV